MDFLQKEKKVVQLNHVFNLFLCRLVYMEANGALVLSQAL